jgi:hypothetical protein
LGVAPKTLLIEAAKSDTLEIASSNLVATKSDTKDKALLSRW